MPPTTTAPPTASVRHAPAPPPVRPKHPLGPWGHTVCAVLIVAVMLFPVYWMVNVSLQPRGSTITTPLIPTSLHFDGYARALHDQGRNLLTSLIVSVASVAFSLLVAAPAAYALAQLRARWAAPVLLAILFSQMIPGIVVANALFSTYNQLGALNSIGGLILADSTHGVPFAILILRAFMSNVPSSLVEAARVDGAGRIRAFCSIVLPVSRNALITAGLFTFLFTWSDFLFALTLTTTEDIRPVTLGLYEYLGAHVADWNTVMATATLSSIPALILLVAAQRYIAAGVGSGALK
ncbi:carbohydrate ABC transporter permease [Streptomyces endophyticus]|uniref:Carbohydrate ABC transporter permease n=1 Tax=Streptomyces endophyticus TaxID=714166 RepID=A0ABU6F1Z0_9ACTN|nr:carbohydrate ABC transporter permease [Streptomyces endophyticus]MEB8336916.1 carbohydrate ABC transporter permease [Streptomyces endophyticus]